VSDEGGRLGSTIRRALYAAVFCALTPMAVAAEETFVGREICASCHEAEAALWQGSDHDKAMQEATESTVLGDFDNASLTHFGVTSTFFRKDGAFFVRTDGPDGSLQQYQIAYTFGFYPLQQYLVAFPGGRYQALPLAWDSRTAAVGGQRWFHLYPNEPVPSTDPLHWTGRNQNWNFMCADCHSTNLHKNFDLATNQYNTQWSEIDVSCEACHGPGSRHVAWAHSPAADPMDHAKGLLLTFADPGNGRWRLDPAIGTAQRTAPRQSTTELETCGRCHSRRVEIASSYVYGHPLLDTHRPELLDARLYHADGQILDEVYEYGSFRQSRMFQMGVTCSDCHDPHSLKLRAPGNEVCGQCHLPAKFDTEDHHHHKPQSAGAQCANCHMPTRTYMVVDVRRDHSIRIPRPDLTLAIGTPNACNACHGDQSAQWAVDKIAAWYKPELATDPHYGLVLDAGRRGLPGADRSLAALAVDAAKPDIVRATALSLLPQFSDAVTPEMIKAYLSGATDSDAMVRTATIDALEPFTPAERLQVAGPLLADPVRAVRIEAARILAPVPADMLTAERKTVLDKADAEFVDAQLASADRPEAHVTLGAFYAERRQPAEAEAAYRTALRLDPRFVPAMVNLADLYRALQREPEGEQLLRQALLIEPENAAVNHALGLLLARARRFAEALPLLRRASDLDASNGRYAYVYGIALNSTGNAAEALSVLRQAHSRQPANVQILVALATISRDVGDIAAARSYAEDLVRRAPNDPSARQLLDSLQQ
jgi:Tfp pilus assembly protein PilF